MLQVIETTRIGLSKESFLNIQRSGEYLVECSRASEVPGTGHQEPMKVPNSCYLLHFLCRLTSSISPYYGMQSSAEGWPFFSQSQSY